MKIPALVPLQIAVPRPLARWIRERASGDQPADLGALVAELATLALTLEEPEAFELPCAPGVH